MKRWAIGSVAFFATFATGASLAWVFIAPAHTLGEPDLNGVPAIVVNDPLAPKVRNLPSELPTTESSDTYVEVFTDEKRIGRKGKNKVEVRCFARKEMHVTEIRFYSRQQTSDWILQQTFEFEKIYAPPCNSEIKDFNNDGFRDLTYWSDSSARGANELRTLFVYDKTTDKLTHITNSNEYPNLEYNRKLNSLTAWHFYGATATTFLRIKGDLLEHFATVSTGEELVAEIADRNGGFRETLRKQMHREDIFTRYSTYDPPRP